VLVTDAGRGSAITVIRSLGRQGWRVIAADSDPRSAGLYSRHANQRLVYPDPVDDPDGFVLAMETAAAQGRFDLIIPMTDNAILPLSEARRRFDGLCQLAIPDEAGVETTTNKAKTLELARELGVPVPQTQLVETVDEALEAAEEFNWPIVLKPQASRVYHSHSAIDPLKVDYANNAEQLKRRMQRYEGRCAILLQQYVVGVGHGVELLMHRGRPIAAFEHRRLREVPTTGGVSSLRESVPLDPAMYRHAVGMLEALHWTGWAMVEFKLSDDGPVLMEINGRAWGSLPLSMHAGVDFPAKLAQLYLEQPPEADATPQLTYRQGVRSRNLQLDLAWIASVLLMPSRRPFLRLPRKRDAMAAILSLFDPRVRLDVASWRDPRPTVALITKTIRYFLRKLFFPVIGSRFILKVFFSGFFFLSH
jgi:predicted ATP-grasp superfamily ATP-dependent carboligase